MELKQPPAPAPALRPKLLIVPYGIETMFCFTRRNRHALLIVPYGIETYPEYCNDPEEDLLIVPYGIETRLRRVRDH